MTARSRQEFRHVALALLLTVLATGLVLYAVVKTESVKAVLQ